MQLFMSVAVYWVNWRLCTVMENESSSGKNENHQDFLKASDTRLKQLSIIFMGARLGRRPMCTDAEKLSF